MLLLALTCLRAETGPHAALSDLWHDVRAGQLQKALRAGHERLHRRAGAMPAAERAALGQVVGRCLLLAGREVQAEDLFQRQLRDYGALSRSSLRWLSSLDRGVMALGLHRLGRAADSFNATADDPAAPVELRVEALAGMATALHGLGDARRAVRTLAVARELAQPAARAEVLLVLDALDLEMQVLTEVRGFDSLRVPLDADSAAALRVRLDACAQRLADLPIAQRRLAFLGGLLQRARLPAATPAAILDGLGWLREQQLTAAEEVARIEAAVVFADHGDRQLAADMLGVLANDEVQMRRHRLSLEISFCVSRLHAMHGRHMDALRLYREYADQALHRLRTEMALIPYSHVLEKQSLADRNDAARLQLPLRYRKAYDFIVEHLDDRDLSIRQVAAHIDVTERALQMAFRSCIGTTPGELIRRKRVERIRIELRQSAACGGVLDVAGRWGVGNRSTLAKSYRQRYDETPTAVSVEAIA